MEQTFTAGRTGRRPPLPKFPYGAVYFRKANPPEADWERDYAVAAADGMNTFRHWFLWGAIETAPGEFEWADYDRQMELAAKYGIRTIVAEMITSAPEWALERFADAAYVAADGTRIKTRMGVSTATGGFGDGSSGALCLDDPAARDAAARFLRELAGRYKSHEALLGYDIWNECNYSPHICYCDRTKAKFRAWLDAKYGGLAALNRAWRRYSYTDWSQVHPPESLGPYPEHADWLEFRKVNFYEQMQWRIDVIRGVDPDHWITAHGIAGGISHAATTGADDWLAASKTEIYGFTWVASRKGSEPWKQWHAVDLVRSASEGKPFWHAEAQGGPLWLQPQVIGRPREDGRVTEPEDIRAWNMISFAGGARGLLFPRWRPLLDGPLFGAFGPYAMDGSRTDRSAMASAIAKWANDPAQERLWRASPVEGDIGVVVLPETQLFDVLLQRESGEDWFVRSAWGAYQGFFDNNMQADWVRPEQMDRYRTLYLPYPIRMSAEHAERISAWVAAGGTLISEGCPAYFGELGRAGTKQPNYGLDAVFGAEEERSEWMPDILQDLSFSWNGKRFRGGVYRQTYRPRGGRVVGRYADGSPAAIEHAYGAGKTLLIGSFPSAAYERRPAADNRALFADLLDWAGVEPHATVSRPGVQARLSAHPDGHLALWIVNPTSARETVTVRLAERWNGWRRTTSHWGDGEPEADGRSVTVAVPGKDAVVLWLERETTGKERTP